MLCRAQVARCCSSPASAQAPESLRLASGEALNSCRPFASAAAVERQGQTRSQDSVFASESRTRSEDDRDPAICAYRGPILEPSRIRGMGLLGSVASG